MIVNIRGTNGSGKTTLARSFITPDRIAAEATIKLPSSKPTIISLSNEGVAVVGPYDGKKTGGCDRISTKADTISAVNQAAEMADVVIFEGIIVSTVYSTWLEYSREIKKTGQQFIWAYLSTPIETCLNRIYDRNGYKEINEALVRDKYRSIDRTAQKAIADGENVLMLDPDNPEQCLRDFLWL